MGGDEWYYAKGDEKHGPVTTAQLRELAAKGEVAPHDLIWSQGKTPDWVPAKSAKGLFSATSPPPLPGEKPTGPPPLHANADTAEAERAGRPRRPAVRGAGQRRSQNRVAILPEWAKWMIAAIASVACLAILVWLLGGAKAPRPGRTRTTSRVPATSADSNPSTAPRRLLVGSWGFGEPQGDVFTVKRMQLLEGGQVNITAVAIDGQGQMVEAAPFEGRWHVSGKNLYVLEPDGSPCLTYLIIKADGQQLEIQDVATGLLKPMGRMDVSALQGAAALLRGHEPEGGQRVQRAAPQTQRGGTGYDAEHEASMQALEEYRQELMKRRELQRKAEQISKEFLF